MPARASSALGPRQSRNVPGSIFIYNQQKRESCMWWWCFWSKSKVTTARVRAQDKATFVMSRAFWTKIWVHQPFSSTFREPPVSFVCDMEVKSISYVRLALSMRMHEVPVLGQLLIIRYFRQCRCQHIVLIYPSPKRLLECDVRCHEDSPWLPWF